jgi:hypothetical protein
MVYPNTYTFDVVYTFPILLIVVTVEDYVVGTVVE